MTQPEIITRALRRLGVVAKDDAPDADDLAQGKLILRSLVAEIEAEAPISWTIDTVPDDVALRLADLLASEVAPDFSIAPPVSRTRAWIRLMAIVRPDDRELDDEGEPEDTYGRYY